MVVIVGVIVFAIIIVVIIVVNIFNIILWSHNIYIWGSNYLWIKVPEQSTCGSKCRNTQAMPELKSSCTPYLEIRNLANARNNGCFSLISIELYVHRRSSCSRVKYTISLYIIHITWHIFKRKKEKQTLVWSTWGELRVTLLHFYEWESSSGIPTTSISSHWNLRYIS